MNVDVTTWTVGFIVGGVVAIVVVVVVLAITATARRIRNQVQEIVDALAEARTNTAPLWAVETTRHVAADVVDLARDLRHRLERRGVGG